MAYREILAEYKTGDTVYNHNIAQSVQIISVSLTPQRQLQYHYQTQKGVTGVAQPSDLGDPPSLNLDANVDAVLINHCSVAEILTAFPDLPGRKGSLAHKIIEVRDESPFDDEISFINRMLEVAPKYDWETISYRMNFEKLPTIGV